MILYGLCVLLCAAAVSGQSCGYRQDPLSPFYWKGYENICTKSICDTYPWLQCDLAREYIMDQADAHFEDDIKKEITYLKKYFNTLIPRPNNQLPYKCTGVCERESRSLQLERLFTDITAYNEQGALETKRMMCIVIGPDVYYQQCGGGNCNIPYGGGNGTFCVPDVTVTIDIWVFCPGAYPGCHKVKFDLPLSCSCKRITCLQDLPPHKSFEPIIPARPKDWDMMNMGLTTPYNPAGIPLGPGNPHTQW